MPAPIELSTLSLPLVDGMYSAINPMTPVTPITPMTPITPTSRYSRYVLDSFQPAYLLEMRDELDWRGSEVISSNGDRHHLQGIHMDDALVVELPSAIFDIKNMKDINLWNPSITMKDVKTGKHIGLALCRPTGTESIYLYLLWVHPSHRGDGLGGRIMKELQSNYKEIELCSYEERVSLYRRHGFAELGDRFVDDGIIDIGFHGIVEDMEEEKKKKNKLVGEKRKILVPMKWNRV